MTSARTFDDILVVTPQNVVADPDRRDQAWRSWESWMTFGLVVLVQLPVVGSLQSSDWVREMPNLMVPALIGLVLAWTLGHSRLSGLVSAGIAVLAGMVVVGGMVMHTMILASPAGPSRISRLRSLPRSLSCTSRNRSLLMLPPLR